MQSHSNDVRRQAYDLWQSGMKKRAISSTLSVDYDTLLGWIKRFVTEGESGLGVRYARCGRKSKLPDSIRIRALELRRSYPSWGAEYIRLHLQREFSDQVIVKANQIRKWLRADGLLSAKTHLPAVKTDWVNQPLLRVQVDAKERLQTMDEQPCCYLNFIDEHTGAALDAFVFPLCSHQPSSSESSS